MKIVVAICTWNRATLLDRTLLELQKLRIPHEDEWELLVVNNNSTDATGEVLDQHAASLPLRQLVEPKQGQCHARNCALQAADGELLVWTDDDVLVDREWLAAYADAFRRWPDAGYFGGPIRPWYETPPPRWIVDNAAMLEGMLVVRELGCEERRFGRGEGPFGANMAFPMPVAKANPFDPAFGLVGNNSVRGDETQVIERLLKAGEFGVWTPTALVNHYVPAGRLTKKYLWHWHYGYGRCQVRHEGIPGARRICGVPGWTLRQYIESRTRSWLLSLTGHPAWFRAYRDAAIWRGVIAESYAANRASSKAARQVHGGRSAAYPPPQRI